MLEQLMPCDPHNINLNLFPIKNTNVSEIFVSSDGGLFYCYGIIPGGWRSFDVVFLDDIDNKYVSSESCAGTDSIIAETEMWAMRRDNVTVNRERNPTEIFYCIQTARDMVKMGAKQESIEFLLIDAGILRTDNVPAVQPKKEGILSFSISAVQY